MTTTLPDHLQRALELDIAWWQYEMATGRLQCDEHVHTILGLEAREADPQALLERMFGGTRMRNAIRVATDPDAATPFDVESSLPMPDGTIHSIRIQGRAMFEGAGLERRAVRLVGTITDVTDAGDARAAILELIESEHTARLEAERAGRLQDEFLAVLGHELRTPLMAVLGWASLLESSTSPEDFQEGISVIQRNARAQGKIIDDLLDISRIAAGKIRLDAAPLPIMDAVRAAIATVESTADAKGIRMTVASNDEQTLINGDLNRLQQIFWNILSNAVKFTPPGGTVDLGVTRATDRVAVSVRDSGEGIAADFLPHVFERFRQADASTSRRHGGLGLGLAIVKELVELHGGSVSAASDGHGKGTTITVTLPVLEDEPSNEESVATPGPISITPPRCSIQGLRVLVVDDDSDALQIARRFLDDGGAQVAAAASAVEALELLARDTFDVIVCDIGMPQQDGYSFLRIVRASGDSTPAIAMTAYARPEDGERAIGAGFQAHLAKPADALDLIASVAEVATNK